MERILHLQGLKETSHLVISEVARCRARWDPTQVNDVTYTGELIPPQAPAQAAPIKITVLGSWWAALLLVCTTMMCLTSAFTAFILYVRPVLQVSTASLPALRYLTSVCPAEPLTVGNGICVLKLPSHWRCIWVQRTERAALACEIAAQGMEEACEELEKASEVRATDCTCEMIQVARSSCEGLHGL